MKTRIKQIKYGDGKATYEVQTLRYFNPLFNRFFKPKNDAEFLALIMCLPFLLIVMVFLLLFWLPQKDFSSIDEAKNYIDEIYSGISCEKEEKEKAKLSKKVVSKTYIKYP